VIRGALERQGLISPHRPPPRNPVHAA